MRKNREEYFREYRKKYYKDVVRPRRLAWLSGKTCHLCGSSEDLHLHHVNRADKVGHSIWTWSEERREKEIAKCIPLCKKCHTEHHRIERMKHGLSAYSRRGCRCDVCRAAKSANNAKRDRRKDKSTPNIRIKKLECANLELRTSKKKGV